MAERMPRAKALRAQPASELQMQLEKLSQQLWQYRLKAKEGSLPQTHLIPAMRRHMARIRTVLKEQA